jgi:hypothetical protein
MAAAHRAIPQHSRIYGRKRHMKGKNHQKSFFNRTKRPVSAVFSEVYLRPKLCPSFGGNDQKSV